MQSYFTNPPGNWEYLGNYPFPWMEGEGKMWKCGYYMEVEIES